MKLIKKIKKGKKYVDAAIKAKQKEENAKIDGE